MTGTALAIVTPICPPSMSTINGPVPLYGTCVMSIFAIDLKSSMAR